ncbi:MAG: FAD-dependent oxidoreductase [Patescibacteria group bacterium]
MTKISKIKAQLISNQPITEQMHQLVFQTEANEKWEFTEGQFVMVQHEVDHELVVRAYSISSLASDLPRLELVVKRVEGGVMSNYLCDLRRGDQVDMDGPYGHFVWNLGQNNNKVLVAIGCGIAPLKSILLKQLQMGGGNVELYLGSRLIKEVPFLKYFSDLQAKNRNFKFYPCVSRETGVCQYSGRVTKVMLEQNIDFAETDFYICGTANMIADLKQSVALHGGNLKNVFNENIYPYAN